MDRISPDSDSIERYEFPNDSTFVKPDIYDNSKIAAKRLVSEQELEMYYNSNSRGGVCNFAVAVVAAVAAIIAAANGAIEAAKRGKSLDTIRPIDLENDDVNNLNVKQLLEIRKKGLIT